MSEIVEELVLQADVGLDDYFRKQGAFQSFVGAAFSIALAAKILGPEATSALQQRASETARRLYGRSPQRNFDVEEPRPDSNDGRLEALVLAFGAEPVLG